MATDNLKEELKDVKLNPKDVLFIEEYLRNGFISRQAAIAAGYKEQNASRAGARILRIPAVKKIIDKRIEEMKKEIIGKYNISNDRILLEIARVAFSNTRNYYKNGKLRNLDDLTDDEAASIIEITQIEKTNGNIEYKYKLADKLKAIDMLAKYKQMYTPEEKETDKQDLPTIVITFPSNGR